MMNKIKLFLGTGAGMVVSLAAILLVGGLIGGANGFIGGLVVYGLVLFGMDRWRS